MVVVVVDDSLLIMNIILFNMQRDDAAKVHLNLNFRNSGWSWMTQDTYVGTYIKSSASPGHNSKYLFLGPYCTLRAL